MSSLRTWLSARRRGGSNVLVRAEGEPQRRFLRLCQPFSLIYLLLLLSALGLYVIPVIIFSLVLATFILAFWFAAPRNTNYQVWGLYVLGFMLFASLSTLADDTGIPVHFQAPISAGRLVFGTSLSSWLQARLYRPGHIGVLDLYCFIIYVSFFLHYLAGLILWRVNVQRFRIFVTALIATIFAGLIGYFLFPEAPPWMASDEGVLSHVVSITSVVSGHLVPGLQAHTSSRMGEDAVAAMPSLHVAVATVVALALYDLHRWSRVFSVIYFFSMCFAVIYLGEHYFVDVLTGMLLAVIVYRIVEWRLSGGSEWLRPWQRPPQLAVKALPLE